MGETVQYEMVGFNIHYKHGTHYGFRTDNNKVYEYNEHPFLEGFKINDSITEIEFYLRDGCLIKDYINKINIELERICFNLITYSELETVNPRCSNKLDKKAEKPEKSDEVIYFDVEKDVYSFMDEDSIFCYRDSTYYYLIDELLKTPCKVLQFLGLYELLKELICPEDDKSMTKVTEFLMKNKGEFPFVDFEYNQERNMQEDSFTILRNNIAHCERIGIKDFLRIDDEFDYDYIKKILKVINGILATDKKKRGNKMDEIKCRNDMENYIQYSLDGFNKKGNIRLKNNKKYYYHSHPFLESVYINDDLTDITFYLKKGYNIKDYEVQIKDEIKKIVYRLIVFSRLPVDYPSYELQTKINTSNSGDRIIQVSDRLFTKEELYLYHELDVSKDIYPVAMEHATNFDDYSGTYKHIFWVLLCENKIIQFLGLYSIMCDLIWGEGKKEQKRIRNFFGRNRNVYSFVKFLESRKDSNKTEDSFTFLRNRILHSDMDDICFSNIENEITNRLIKNMLIVINDLLCQEKR